MYGKELSLRTLSREIALPKSALRKRSRCYWQTRSNVKGQHVPTRNNQRQKCMRKTKRKKEKEKKQKNKQKKTNKTTHLLLRILAVIGRYGPHLIILMLFVTQNNF